MACRCLSLPTITFSEPSFSRRKSITVPKSGQLSGISATPVERTQHTHEPSTYSQMLVVKVEQHLITTLILLLDLFILEVASSGHPSVDLVAKGLNVVLHTQRLPKLLDRIRVFVAGCEHAEGNLDALGVGRVDHCGVNFGDGGEGGAGLSGQGDDLSHKISHPRSKTKDRNTTEASHLPAPAHAQTAPLLDPRRLLLNLPQQPGHLLRRIRRARGAREEISNLLLLLVRVGREVAVREGFAEEEVGHEDLVLVAGVGVGEDVGALDGLGGEAEDVVDDEDGGGGVGGAGGVALHAVEVDVFALLLVALGDGGRDIAAGLAVSLLCFHDGFVSVRYCNCSECEPGFQ